MNMAPNVVRVAALAWSTACSTAWLGVPSALAVPPAPMGEPAPATDVDTGLPTAIELLADVERYTGAVETFQADVNIVRVFAIQSDVNVRSGSLVIRTELEPAIQGRPEAGEPVRQLRLDIERQITDGRIGDERTVYIFDGSWLAEIRPTIRQFIRRQVAAPGETYDPLRSGDGEIVFPFGRDASGTLELFDARAATPTEGLTDEDDETIGLEPEHIDALMRSVEGTVQLVLEPKAGTSASDTVERSRVWYDRETMMPRMTMTLSPDGDLDVVQLSDVRVNQPLPENLMSTQAPPPNVGWTVRVEPYRGEIRESEQPADLPAESPGDLPGEPPVAPADVEPDAAPDGRAEDEDTP